MNSKRLMYLLPVAASILYFITVKQVLSNSIYMLIAVILSVYYFPIQPVLLLNRVNESTLRVKAQFFGTNLLFSILICLSILNLYIGDNRALNNIIGIFAIVNFMATIYYYMTEKLGENVILHFLFLVFVSAVIVV
jgi:hypothetical protein